jgi:hypothetical protein
MPNSLSRAAFAAPILVCVSAWRAVAMAQKGAMNIANAGPLLQFQFITTLQRPREKWAGTAFSFCHGSGERDLDLLIACD